MLSTNKPDVILAVLVGEGVGVRWGLRAHAKRAKRAGDGHIDRQTLPMGPEGEGWAPTGGGAELLGNGVKKGLTTKVEGGPGHVW